MSRVLSAWNVSTMGRCLLGNVHRTTYRSVIFYLDKRIKTVLIDVILEGVAALYLKAMFKDILSSNFPDPFQTVSRLVDCVGYMLYEGVRGRFSAGIYFHRLCCISTGRNAHVYTDRLDFWRGSN